METHEATARTEMQAEFGRRRTSKQRVLEALTAGPKTNVELNEICYRYGARIHELRRAGHQIEGPTRTGHRGVFTYELHGAGFPS